MCGRFVQTLSPDDYAAALGQTVGGAETVSGPPCYNVAPTLPVLAIRIGREGYRWVRLRWGLIPSWSKGPDHRMSMINARAETVGERAAFRGPFRHQRCLVPADGFYEWRVECQGRQPYFIHRRDGGPLFLAGLWSHWEGPEQTVNSCTVIVAPANRTIAPLHDRMPVVLDREAALRWLDRTSPPEVLQALLQPAADDVLEFYSVSKRVNSPRNEGADLIDPVPTACG